MSEEGIYYQIDHSDTIVNVSSNWTDFAERNLWLSNDVLGHKLWEYIQGTETQYLYRELFQLIRKEKS